MKKTNYNPDTKWKRPDEKYRTCRYCGRICKSVLGKASHEKKCRKAFAMTGLNSEDYLMNAERNTMADNFINGLKS